MEAKKYKNILLWGTAMLASLLLTGCQFALLDPKGAVGREEKDLIIMALLLMLIVVIPVILMTIYFTYKYRASNASAEYTPDWSHSSKIEFVVWVVPIIIILILGTLTWRSTHSLDPYQPLKSPEKKLVVQVVSADWKWIFIYPEQGIATVNEVVFPKNVPVDFKLVADNIMNSFFIPRLGTQIYAMPAMMTQVNLIAEEVGVYKGFSASYSGQGFSDMKFNARVVEDRQAFAKWVGQVKKSSEKLVRWSDYLKLVEPSINHPVTYYSQTYKNLFRDVISRYPGAMNMDMDKMHMTEKETQSQHEKNQHMKVHSTNSHVSLKHSQTNSQIDHKG